MIKTDLWESIERERRARAYSSECALILARQRYTKIGCIATAIMLLVIIILA